MSDPRRPWRNPSANPKRPLSFSVAARSSFLSSRANSKVCTSSRIRFSNTQIEWHSKCCTNLRKSGGLVAFSSKFPACQEENHFHAVSRWILQRRWTGQHEVVIEICSQQLCPPRRYAMEHPCQSQKGEDAMSCSKRERQWPVDLHSTSSHSWLHMQK